MLFLDGDLMVSKIEHLIALDLDGTSVRYEPCLEMEPRLISYLRSVREAGVRWVLNSDRYGKTLIDIANRLSPEERPVAVLSMQRFIYFLNDENKYVPCEEWNDKQIKKHQLLWDQISPLFDEWNQKVEAGFNPIDKVINDIVFAYMVPTESIEDLRQMMRDFLAPFPEAQVSGNHDWTFMLHSSFSKASVLEAVADRLDVEQKNIIAVGDGLNDLSMLNGDVTARVGCPANASSEVVNTVKNAGGMVSSKESAAGTMEIIKHYLKME